MAKKATKKTVKKVKTSKKKPVKKASKKPSKKTANKTPDVKVVKPVTDSTGVVVMKSVDDPDTSTEGKATTVKPHVDKETGVLTMHPED